MRYFRSDKRCLDKGNRKTPAGGEGGGGHLDGVPDGKVVAFLLLGEISTKGQFDLGRYKIFRIGRGDAI